MDSASERIICLALSTLADIGSEDMCRDLNERVLLMFSHKSCHVKKRAGLAGIRVLRKCPEFVEDYSRAVEKLLIDTSHAVVGSGLYLLV